MLLPSIFENNFMDELFNEAFKMPSMRNSVTNCHMNADIREYKDKYELDIELPGYDKKDVSAELKDGYLIVAAKKIDKREEKEDSKYVRRECFSGACQRSFYVGKEVNEKDIKAAFVNGVLKIEVPKIEPKKVEEKKKCITIN